MIRFLRTARPKSLLVTGLALSGLLVGGAVIATGATSSSQRPEPKPLAQALANGAKAVSQADFTGATARISFSNRLLDSIDTGQGASPLLGSGSGRLWVSSDGKVRIELQSDSGGGDVQLLADGTQAWISLGDGSTVYRLKAPAADPADKKPHADTPPTVTSIEAALKSVAGDVKVSDPVPDNVGGRPAYTVTVEPVDTSGLIGGAKLSWESVNGVPLGIAIFAKGQSEPALDLHATEVSYGPVDASVFDIQPPAGAKVTDVNLTDLAAQAKAKASKAKAAAPKPVTGLAAVRADVGFKLVAPAAAGGLDRGYVVKIGTGKDVGAAIHYGTGLGAVTVIERPAAAKQARKSGTPESNGMQLPTKQVGGLNLTELGTVLGSVAEFSREGVSYTVFGSVPLDRLEAVASGL